MLSDRESLLSAIRAHPDEDTPRLMFADWLDEHGDAERAEFIRVQCEAARLADDGSDSQALYEFLVDRDYITRPAADWTTIDPGIARRIALANRFDEMYKEFPTAWLPKLPKNAGLSWDGFRRGFPYRLELGNITRAVKSADRVRESVPAGALIAHTFTSRIVEQLGDAGFLGWVRALELHGEEVASGLREFGHRPEAAGVRVVDVTSADRDAVVAALTDAPHWTGLRELTLRGPELSQPASDALFYARHLRSLRRLALGACDWAGGAMVAFVAGGFQNLVSLSITDCHLTDDAVEALAGCPDLENLRTLELGYNDLTGRGATAVLCSPHLKNVAFLGLEANPCTGLDAKRLAQAEPGGLRMLHAHGCRLSTGDVRALAKCPRLRTLWYLDLDANRLETPAVRALVRGFKDFCPPIVWLTHNGIDDSGAKLLANWKAAAALRVLHLRYNQTSDDAARLLLDSPNLTNLDDLGVSGASDETTARLKARFAHFGTGYP